MADYNIVSVSGGKDSTALLLLAKEREAENLIAVFCDTGNEHKITYDYVNYLSQKVHPIITLKADFSKNLERKKNKLQKILNGELDEKEKGLKYPYSKEDAKRIIPLLQESGNPFLDQVVARGMFPTTMRRFCSEELKRNVLVPFQMQYVEAGNDVYAWQGVRADESAARANYVENELKFTAKNGCELWNYRPILKWTVEDVFAMHKKHGVDPNPLYKMGMKRVGCMPCIHAGHKELVEIANRFPEEIDRLRDWEKKVGQTSRAPDLATFFEYSRAGLKSANAKYAGIDAQITRSRNRLDGGTPDMFEEKSPLCSSIYGLCE